MNAQILTSPQVPAQNSTPLLYKLLVVLGMVALMGGSLTGVMTYINIGYSETFLSDWFSSFLIAAVTVIPAGIFLMTLLTKAVEKILPNTSETKRNLVVGVSMAIIMESAMALTTTLNNVGFDSLGLFLSTWLHSFLAALPVALTLILIISMTVKPKIEQFLKS
ncbi:DUF2798 domain-containing protein [Shewanella youngdeokensis]|uniref:DUF2798 domain-containing protein n=1 Tax=Shewanella youngdeokensis TaxID=2999068 RepID=A0ABZ0JWB1_9GAMM|nr:DUF2798 domain-containing protein [Shewanella sp. DAU334]